ncbi:MAG: SigB/SigF/SigG family RNA polymerase sigma factor [Actinomycetota bacterium]|nr:SigB/SigF/SigG family RNA polymerase sigma factor [Actinomycetota bacterium]
MAITKSGQRRPLLSNVESKRLFRRLRKTNDPEIRNVLIESHLGLVDYLARRFTGRGEPADDLTQVAAVALVKAVDRYDPDRNVEFSTFAAPTIVGELKRHFRDNGWAVRVPRTLQELTIRLPSVIEKLSQKLGRSPTVAEIGADAEATEDHVLEALECAQAYTPVSLDALTLDTDERSPHERIGDVDDAMEALDDHVSVAPLLRDLPARERRILYLRFSEELTQREIGREIGISQMHVSRLLARTLRRLRLEVGASGDPPRDRRETRARTSRHRAFAA